MSRHFSRVNDIETLRKLAEIKLRQKRERISGQAESSIKREERKKAFEQFSKELFKPVFDIEKEKRERKKKEEEERRQKEADNLPALMDLGDNDNIAGLLGYDGEVKEGEVKEGEEKQGDAWDEGEEKQGDAWEEEEKKQGAVIRPLGGNVIYYEDEDDINNFLNPLLRVSAPSSGRKNFALASIIRNNNGAKVGLCWERQSYGRRILVAGYLLDNYKEKKRTAIRVNDILYTGQPDDLHEPVERSNTVHKLLLQLLKANGLTNLISDFIYTDDLAGSYRSRINEIIEFSNFIHNANERFNPYLPEISDDAMEIIKQLGEQKVRGRGIKKQLKTPLKKPQGRPRKHPKRERAKIPKRRTNKTKLYQTAIMLGYNPPKPFNKLTNKEIQNYIDMAKLSVRNAHNDILLADDIPENDIDSNNYLYQLTEHFTQLMRNGGVDEALRIAPILIKKGLLNHTKLLKLVEKYK